MKEIIAAQFEKWRVAEAQGWFDTPFTNNKMGLQSHLSTYDEFLHIPLTYKNEIRSTSLFDRSNVKMEDIYGVFSSSGTTGEKTFYIYSKEDVIVQQNCAKEILGGVGIQAQDMGAILAPIDTGVMAHAMMWQFTAVGASYVTCTIPSPQEILHLVKSLPVTVLATMPNVMSSLPLTDEILQITRNSTVKKVVLGGNYLSEKRRKLVEKIWEAECYNFFGMSEIFGPIAGECRFRNGLHYNPDNLMIELLNPDTLQPVKSGEIGIAVYTTLWNKGFPLLRYWSDDFFQIKTDQCLCGRSTPRILFKGRLHDCTKTSTGKYVFPVDVEEILMGYGFVGAFQVFEDKNQTNYAIKVEQDGRETEGLKKMNQELDELFDAHCTVEICLEKSLVFGDKKHLRFIRY